MCNRLESVQKPDVPGQPLDAEDSFAAVYRRYYPRLTAIAGAVLGRWEDAEDIVPQAVGIAVEKGIRFDTPQRVSGWLAGIVRNCALNHRRNTLGRKTYPTDPAGLGAVSDDVDAINPVLNESGELLPTQDAFDDHVLRALNSLGEDVRCCLLLRTVLNLEYAEISELLQIPAGTAMSHVHRSRRALRVRLAEYQGTVFPDSVKYS